MPVDTTLEKPLPNNLDVERSVLGAILLDSHALNPAIEHLRADDFFLDQHRRVFTQMIALGESQQAIDLVTLTEELNRKGELEASGGAPYLASLADGMPKVSNIEHYARIVKEKAILRNLIHTTHNIQQRAFEGEDGADAILDGAESDIFALAEDRVRAGLLPIKDIVRDNFERLERIFREGKSITGIPTEDSFQPFKIVADDVLYWENGAGAEPDGKHRDSRWTPGGHVQPGNVQGIAAAEAGGVRGADRRAQIPHRPSEQGRLAADDGIAGNHFSGAAGDRRRGLAQRAGNRRQAPPPEPRHRL